MIVKLEIVPSNTKIEEHKGEGEEDKKESGILSEEIPRNSRVIPVLIDVDLDPSYLIQNFDISSEEDELVVSTSKNVVKYFVPTETVPINPKTKQKYENWFNDFVPEQVIIPKVVFEFPLLLDTNGKEESTSSFSTKFDFDRNIFTASDANIYKFRNFDGKLISVFPRFLTKEDYNNNIFFDRGHGKLVLPVRSENEVQIWNSNGNIEKRFNGVGSCDDSSDGFIQDPWVVLVDGSGNFAVHDCCFRPHLKFYDKDFKFYFSRMISSENCFTIDKAGNLIECDNNVREILVYEWQ